ncbi:MAG TPA: ATP-binding cassette domain-containing protein [Tepidisphaeraceae bacterium]|nr:ATP-binding cassette domain-containing protein [Tepidisphaeraceae bacterium]
MSDEKVAERALIEIPHGAFGYAKRPVVRLDNLRLVSGRSLGIFGPNGSGKTTLVRGLMGLLPPMEGQVVRQRDNLHFGYLPQHRALDHNWPMSGIDAASMAISARSRLGRVGRNRAQILEAMRTLGVDDLAHRNFSGLSGGQQQRLLLAGAVACKPDILVLDEPTEGLDLRSRKNLLDFLRGALSTGLCIALISHDVQDILQSCDEVAWLHPGEDIGQPSTVEMITPNDLADRVTHARRAS